MEITEAQLFEQLGRVTAEVHALRAENARLKAEIAAMKEAKATASG